MATSSSINRYNECHIAKSLLKSAFAYAVQTTGFGIKQDKDHTNLLIRLPRQRKYEYSLPVRDAMNMTTGQRYAFCRTLALKIERDE